VLLVAVYVQRRAVGLGVSDHKMQEKLRIVSGSAAGRKLVSFKSPQTRPMMEKVSSCRRWHTVPWPGVAQSQLPAVAYCNQSELFSLLYPGLL
jgi:hypothetical protein